MNTLAQRARAGAEALDRQLPGWEEEIVLSKLDMGDYQHCVIGQLFDGAYSYGLQILAAGEGMAGGEFNNSTAAERFGLDYFGEETYADLRHEWKLLIEDRLHVEVSG